MKTAIATLVLSMLLLAAVPAAAGLQEDLVAMDKAQWTAWSKKDGEVFRKTLTPDAVQIVAGSGALAGRDTIADAVAGLSCDVKSFDFQDVKLRQLTPDVAILSYTATQDSTCDGAKLPAKVQATSVYVQKNGKWLSANYQETAVD
jgi:uncharacterized protein (TIGR02246 family)